MRNAHRHLRERVSRGLKMCLFVSEPSNSDTRRGLLELGNAGFSYPIRCEPIPLAALDHLSKLVPSTFHPAWRRSKL